MNRNIITYTQDTKSKRSGNKSHPNRSARKLLPSSSMRGHFALSLISSWQCSTVLMMMTSLKHCNSLHSAPDVWFAEPCKRATLSLMWWDGELAGLEDRRIWEEIRYPTSLCSQYDRGEATEGRHKAGRGGREVELLVVDMMNGWDMGTNIPTGYWVGPGCADCVQLGSFCAVWKTRTLFLGS